MSMKVKHWQDPVSVIAGAWLAVSPWVFSYQMESQPMWNAVIVGILMALIALYALFQVSAWEEWLNFVLAAWLIASPWVLGFSAHTAAMLNAVIVGALVVVLSLWALGTDRDIGGWFSTAH